jgi:hypothetical protein
MGFLVLSLPWEFWAWVNGYASWFSVSWEFTRCSGANLQAAARRRRLQIKPSQRCQTVYKTQKQARREGHKEAWIAGTWATENHIARPSTNPPSPTGPTTRPPKSTLSRAARHCTWSLPSVAAAREKRLRRHTNNEARTLDSDRQSERKHDRRPPAQSAMSN